MAENSRRGRVLLVLPESNEEKELVSHLEAEDFQVISSREGQAAYEILDTEKKVLSKINGDQETDVDSTLQTAQHRTDITATGSDVHVAWNDYDS